MKNLDIIKLNENLHNYKNYENHWIRSKLKYPLYNKLDTEIGAVFISNNEHNNIMLKNYNYIHIDELLDKEIIFWDNQFKIFEINEDFFEMNKERLDDFFFFYSNEEYHKNVLNKGKYIKSDFYDKRTNFFKKRYTLMWLKIHYPDLFLQRLEELETDSIKEYFNNKTFINIVKHNKIFHHFFLLKRFLNIIETKKYFKKWQKKKIWISKKLLKKPTYLKTIFKKSQKELDDLNTYYYY